MLNSEVPYVRYLDRSDREDVRLHQPRCANASAYGLRGYVDNTLPSRCYAITMILRVHRNFFEITTFPNTSGLYRLLKALRPELFKPAPCLLMPPDLQKQRVMQHNDRRMASINPLHCDPIPVSLSYINGMYWVGMNTSWMVLVDGRSNWMLVEVYTRQLTPFLRLTLHCFGTAAQNTRNLTVSNMIPSLICSRL